MKFCSSLILRPVCFLILLGLSSFMISKLCSMTKQIDHKVTLQSHELRNKSFSEIETNARLLLPLNSSTSNLARSLSSSLNGTELSFLAIQTKVAPTLFLALSTIPQVSQVSYTGLDGLLFSFYKEDDQTRAVYSNTTYSSTWYTQPVNRDTGKLYGQPISTNTIVSVNASWLQEALNRTIAYSSLGLGWNKAQDLLFLNTVAMDGRGLISLGFPAKVVVDHFAGLDFHGGDFHLATHDGKVLVKSKLPGTQIVVYNGTVAVQLMKPDGDFEDRVSNHSCKGNDDYDDDWGPFHVNIKGMKHIFYCSRIEIAGVHSVYILAFPTKGMETLVHENSKLAITLLVLMFVIVVVSLCIFIILILKAARREMFLCAALIKQMESTHQAERKSMNKSLAFASASHDVRASLTAITGLIELCHEDATPNSELEANLVYMNTCTMDLLGILNSVLDTSKIEAGKMQLEEEEFNIVQLLEDVADMYYPIGMKKGVDVILDPCDGSILKLYLVRGDRGKLKQILCNLLSNAVKFTPEGHVSVRAVVKKTSKENAIIASNRKGVVNFFSRLCYKSNGSFGNLDDLQTVQQNPNYMEFVFEVDDTGKGIPKDKQKSVFENFVQVKETALGQGGCGLGLGIVQSLVRLMGGEIKIVDKEAGERGTCFRFNIFLATCDPISTTDIEDQGNYPSTDHFHQYFGLNIRSPARRSDASHVVLLIAGEERRRITKKLMENFGIKVSVVKRGKDLFHVLEKIKHKLEHFQFSSSEKIQKTEVSLNDYLNKSASNDSNEGGSSATNDNRKSNSRSPSNSCFVLIVIDARAGPFLELCSHVANFMKDIQNSSKCKVVWLDNPATRNANTIEPNEDNSPIPPCDHMLSKPFHGSRFYRVLGLLPEFGGAYNCNSPKTTSEEVGVSMRPNVSTELTRSGISLTCQKVMAHGSGGKSSDQKPLSGKKVMVVEDVALLRMLATTSLVKLGAIVDVCENGQEAFDQVCKALSDQRREGHSMALPYDYIFMDCEMPVMDGYDATRLIRLNEKHYGVHIPIIALTANAMPEEASKTKDAGMDFHLTKPLQVEKLLDAIRCIGGK